MLLLWLTQLLDQASYGLGECSAVGCGGRLQVAGTSETAAAVAILQRVDLIAVS
jgi:hypothetical protein